jgi:2-hydroxychromene-2-carboxylate isomerase
MENLMGLAATERQLALRESRFVKAELKRAGLTYADLAERLKDHGLTAETEASIKAKLRRGPFAATWLHATLAALGREGLKLEEQ